MVLVSLPFFMSHDIYFLKKGLCIETHEFNRNLISFRVRGVKLLKSVVDDQESARSKSGELNFYDN